MIDEVQAMPSDAGGCDKTPAALLCPLPLLLEYLALLPREQTTRRGILYIMCVNDFHTSINYLHGL